MITGAGAGMGRALARRFDRAGVEVFLSDVDLPAARETVRAAAEESEQTLRAEFEQKQERAANLQAYREQDRLIQVAQPAHQ